MLYVQIRRVEDIDKALKYMKKFTSPVFFSSPSDPSDFAKYQHDARRSDPLLCTSRE